MEKPLVGFSGSVASAGKEEGCDCPVLSSRRGGSSTWSAEVAEEGEEEEGQFSGRSSLL